MTKRSSLLHSATMLGILFMGASGPAVCADTTVADLFASNMVLQRDRPVAIWGWADPGQQVSVTFAGQTVTAAAGAADPSSPGRGRWTATLPPMPAEMVPRDLTIVGPNRIVLANVLVGDVWICAGQSNMSMGVSGFKGEGVADDLAGANFPAIRHFSAGVVQADTPQQNLAGKWKICTPKEAGSFTAVGFYFARAVQQETKVPIGLLRVAKGSTRIECWLSEETFLTTPELAFLGDKMRASLTTWNAAKAEALARGATAESPEWPAYPFSDAVKRPIRGVTHYNGMIAPLSGLAVRGILWYQGEGNAEGQAAAAQYRHLLRALASSWRAQLGGQQAILPFYVVQLPAYTPATDDPAATKERVAYLREAQRVSLQTIPHSGMAVTIDIGDADDIHPTNKDDVGKRLARLALADLHGWKQGERCGPLFHKMVVTGDQARIFFTNAASGLMAANKSGRAPPVEVAAALERFAICGQDRVWKWGRAVIEPATGTVVVSAEGISTPVAVRYAFANNPAGANLYNRDGLPASPFCTDDVFPEK